MEAGRGGIISDLLEAGADFKTRDERGRTLLHIAASKGKPDMVQLLLREEADINALDSWGVPPLFLAIENDHMATARALLAGGANASAPHGACKRTALHMAAQTGHVEMLRAMIEHDGPDVNAAGSLGYTALHCAALNLNGTSDAIDALVEAGANIEALTIYDATPLHLAASDLKPVAVSALLRRGADVNAQGDVGDTPLHCAVATSETLQEAAEVVDLLLRAGADVNAQDDTGGTPSHNVASKAGTQGAAEVVDLLLRSGADETITDEDCYDAMNVVGTEVEEQDRLTEGFERVRKLLANASADRNWRRRGYLVLCRAHPDRVQPGQEGASKHCEMAPRARSKTKLARAQVRGRKKEVGDSLASERTCDFWIDVVAKVLLWLKEEGIFRTIVGYLGKKPGEV